MKLFDPKRTIKDNIISMSCGNPGAESALNDMCDNLPLLYLNSKEPVGIGLFIEKFDRIGIHGLHIYNLWNNICFKNATLMVAVIEMVSLSKIEESVLRDAVNKPDYSGTIHLDSKRAFLDYKEIFPEFDPEDSGYRSF